MQVVDRIVETEVEVTVVTHIEVPATPRPGDWPRLLADLIEHLDRGRVYDRDLLELAQAINDVLQAMERRPGFQRLLRRRS